MKQKASSEVRLSPYLKAQMASRDSIGSAVFGRPFVKRFALCYQTVVLSCLSCLCVTLVYCGQTVGWIKMLLGTEVGIGPGHIVLDGHIAPFPRKRGRRSHPHFSTHVYCGQEAG